MLDTAHEDRRGKTRVLQDALADEGRDFSRRGSFRKAQARHAAGFGEFALLVPAAQAVKFVAADFYIEVLHGDEVRKRGDFILGGKDDVGGADGIGEAELFELGKALGQVKCFVAINARARNRFIERNFGRPLRDGIVALRAFVEADLYRLDFAEEFGGTHCKQIGEAGSRARVNQGRATLVLEFSDIAELLGLEGIAREVRAEIHVMGAKTEGGAEDDFVEDGGRSVNDQLAALCGANDGAEVARVDGGDGDGGLLAEKAAGAGRIAVATPDVVTLAFQQLCEERTGGPRSQYEDAHGFSKLYHRAGESCARKAWEISGIELGNGGA